MFQGVACQMGLLGVAWLFTIGAQAVEVKPKGSVLFQDDFQDGRIGPSWSVVEHRDETAKTPTYFRAFRESVEGKDVLGVARTVGRLTPGGPRAGVEGL